MSDPTPRWLLRLLDERDGHVDAWSGEDTGRLVPQHRLAGMGGSPTKHTPANVVWLDSLVNGWIETIPSLQREAYRRGIKLRPGEDPERIPVQHAGHRAWVRLTDEPPYVRPVTAAEVWALGQRPEMEEGGQRWA